MHYAIVLNLLSHLLGNNVNNKIMSCEPRMGTRCVTHQWNAPLPESFSTSPPPPTLDFGLFLYAQPKVLARMPQNDYTRIKAPSV
jgi:hypothetical protein